MAHRQAEKVTVTGLPTYTCVIVRFVIALCLAACGSKKPNNNKTNSSAPSSIVAFVDGQSAALDAAPARAATLVFVEKPQLLAPIDKQIASFTSLLDTDKRERIWKTIESDLQAAQRGDRSLGVSVRGHSHRLFNKRWLREGTWELTGIAPRFDLRPNTKGTCGDVRLIYRLSYRTTQHGHAIYSRLPATAVIVLDGEAEASASKAPCAAAMAQWRIQAPDESDADFIARITANLEKRKLAGIKQVLTNFQYIRWPSSVKGDLGGHAEYVLRKFDGTTLKAARAESSLDVKRLKRDKAAKAKLKRWIVDNLDAIDSGTYQIPDEFLAMTSRSFSPRGFSRLANRQASALFTPADFAGVTIDGKTIKSARGLLRRLDQASCAGCHQSRSTAGFHWLGHDPGETPAGNALFVPASPTFVDELVWRKSVFAAMQQGNNPPTTRPFKDHTRGKKAGAGDHCGLGDATFSDWQCETGLRCQPFDNPQWESAVGQCVREGAPIVGEACEYGPIRSNYEATKDRARNKRIDCEDAYCNGNRVGFPGGLCTAGCDASDPRQNCGAIAQLTPFNNCLARKRPFTECVSKHVTRAGLRACATDTPCRDDYICAKTPDGDGGCIPPYFLFQLRVDGHPEK